MNKKFVCHYTLKYLKADPSKELEVVSERDPAKALKIVMESLFKKFGDDLMIEDDEIVAVQFDRLEEKALH